MLNRPCESTGRRKELLKNKLGRVRPFLSRYIPTTHVQCFPLSNRAVSSPYTFYVKLVQLHFGFLQGIFYPLVVGERCPLSLINNAS